MSALKPDSASEQGHGGDADLRRRAEGRPRLARLGLPLAKFNSGSDGGAPARHLSHGDQGRNNKPPSEPPPRTVPGPAGNLPLLRRVRQPLGRRAQALGPGRIGSAKCDSGFSSKHCGSPSSDTLGLSQPGHGHRGSGARAALRTTLTARRDLLRLASGEGSRRDRPPVAIPDLRRRSAQRRGSTRCRPSSRGPGLGLQP
jgi:hypothetical protein